MKKISLFLMLLISTAILKAQDNSDDKKQAIAMLNTFYTAYMSEFSAKNINQLEIHLSQLRKKYCTVKCQKQYKRLVSDTDSDPIINAQDSDAKWAKTLAFVSDAKNLNLYTISYSNDEYGEDGKLHKQTTSIKLIVIKQNNTYKINLIL